MARTNRLRLNFLGVISLLIGVAAFVATRRPLFDYGPMPIAGLGIGVGVLGFLLSIMTGKWGSGWPVLGILVCLGAMAFVEYDNGTLPQWWAKFHSKPPAPAVVTPVPDSVTPAQPETPRPHSIFDAPGSYTSDSNRSPSPAPAVHIPPASPAVMSQHPAAPVIAQPAGPTILQARAKLDAATAAVEHSLANDPNYLQAQKDVADADVKRKAALTSDGPGSQAVQDASSQWLDAKSKLRKLVDTAAAKDTATAAAQQELKQAESSVHGTKFGGGR